MSLWHRAVLYMLPTLVKLYLFCGTKPAAILTGFFLMAFTKGMISHCFSFAVLYLQFLKFHAIGCWGIAYS